MSDGTSPRARVLVTGDELLRGFIQDANSGFIAEQLRDAGIELVSIRILGDDFDVIADAVRAGCTGDDAVDVTVVTGGLGPTHDDRTSEAVASALGVELELQPAALEVVETRIRAFGRMRTPEEAALFAPGNRKQATLPANARWVEPLGTAPGYVVEAGAGRIVIVLPGPPSELRHTWHGIAATSEYGRVLARVAPRHERLLRAWGVPESAAARALEETGHVDDDGARVTLCARDGELEIALRGSDTARVDALVAALDAALGDAVFARDDHRGIVELVAEGLEALGWTLATVESCTGGMLGSMLTGVAGSSGWYVGGLVTYSNEAKRRLAAVSAEVLEAHGAVSEPVAREMAAGGRSALGADVAVGITGIAGPGGGSDEKPVGTVHVAIASPDGGTHRALRIPGDRETVRRRSSVIALHELRMLLEASQPAS